MRTIDIRQKERAERVAALLAKSGLKPAELAKKLGVARAAAAKWYRGASAPTGARLEAWPLCLGSQRISSALAKMTRRPRLRL